MTVFKRSLPCHRGTLETNFNDGFGTVRYCRPPNHDTVQPEPMRTRSPGRKLSSSNSSSTEVPRKLDASTLNDRSVLCRWAARRLAIALSSLLLLLLIAGSLRFGMKLK